MTHALRRSYAYTACMYFTFVLVLSVLFCAVSPAAAQQSAPVYVFHIVEYPPYFEPHIEHIRVLVCSIPFKRVLALVNVTSHY